MREYALRQGTVRGKSMIGGEAVNLLRVKVVGAGDMMQPDVGLVV